MTPFRRFIRAIGEIGGLPSLIGLASGLLISGVAVHDQLCDLPLRILDELNGGRGCGRLESRFRFHQQRKLRLVETLHEQQIASHRDDGFASWRKLINPGIFCEYLRTQPESGATECSPS